MSERNISSSDQKNKSEEPNYWARRAGALVFSGIAAFGAVKGVQTVKAHVENAVPTLNVPDSQKEIAKGLEAGDLTTIVIDNEHPTIYSLADSLTDGDPRRIVDALVNQNSGSSEVQMGQRFVAPNNGAAQQLHNVQFEDSK